jgi:hypothetical protein
MDILKRVQARCLAVPFLIVFCVLLMFGEPVGSWLITIFSRMF